ncbi:MAG: glycosyltransferase [Bacteroidia bacterium]|nr:glycosyltransferase [Bacteroidia bacterium]
MSSVALIIPTYNNLPELRRCLAALTQQTYTDFTAYVCVDGSTDETLPFLEKYAPPFVRTLTHPDGRNRGRNATRNLALPYLSSHQWVAFLDSDSIPLPDWLENFFAASPQTDEVLLGKIIYFSHENPNIWKSYLAWREKMRSRHALSHKNFITINAFLSCQALLQVGGMDTQMRKHGLGDVELGWRLQAAGYRFRYIATARVWSTVQQTPLQALIRLYDMARHNLPYLHRKHSETRHSLFGGIWLTHPSRKLLLRPWLSPLIARALLRTPSLYPKWIVRWVMRYLVFYAVARGFWGLRLGLPPLERESPSL